jgi:hypothetical protein
MATQSKDDGMETTTWLQCKVSPGQFSGELVVSANDFQGSIFSLFVPDEYVQHQGQLTEGQTVDGLVQVQVLGRKDDLALVRLPRQPLENGQIVTVPITALKRMPAPEPA